MKAKKSRIEFIDIAKGITIFLVVWGHTANNAVLVDPNCPLFTRILYSFHMPLFFALSGLSMKATPFTTWAEWKAFIRKNILSLLIPYFVWALIYCTFKWANIPWILYGSWYALTTAATLTSLWYLVCLFIARMFAQLVVSYVPKRGWWWVIGAAMMLVGVLLPKFTIGYPWCFDVAFVAGACVLFGVLLKNPLIELSVQRMGLLVLLLIASVAVYMSSFLIDGTNFTILLMCKGQYGDSIGWVIRAIAGSFAVVSLSMIMRQLAEETLTDNQAKPIIYIGQYTMGIFLLHKPFLQEVALPFMTNLTGNFLSQGLINFITALGVMLLCLPVCNIVMHYIPELIGINRN